MKYNEINSLLEKYFAGETSLEEEQQLRLAFARKDLPEALKVYQPMFLYLNEAGQEKAPHSMRKTPFGPGRNPKIRLFLVSGLAASVLLVVGLLSLLKFSAVKPNNTEALQAYQDTRKALHMVAKKLNSGTASLDKMALFNEQIEKPIHQLNKMSSGSEQLNLINELPNQMEKIEEINKLNKYSKLIINLSE